MKQLTDFINVHQGSTVVHATDENLNEIVKEELKKFGRSVDLNYIDVSKVTIMKGTFAEANIDYGIKGDELDIDISKWDVHNVKVFDSTFEYSKFNGDISEWDVSNGVEFHSMFFQCHWFNCDVSKWDMRKSENISYMFYGCYEFNQDLSNWKTPNLLKMNKAFFNCYKLKSDFSSWDVSSLKSYDEYIFYATRLPKNKLPRFK